MLHAAAVLRVAVLGIVSTSLYELLLGVGVGVAVNETAGVGVGVAV
jgi:hypothetical protein